MTLRVSEKLGIHPNLSSNGGWSYRPDQLREADPGPIFTEHARREWRHQATTLFRPHLVDHRDPVPHALMLDALMRMEHNHVFTSRTLSAFMNREYPYYAWNPVQVGKIVMNLVEAAKMPGLNEETPIVGRKINNRWTFRVCVTPRSWRWFAIMRFRLGKMAEEALEEAKLRKWRETPTWDEFPWEIAKDS